MADSADVALTATVEPLHLSELDAVMQVERSAGPYCWSRADWQSSLEQDICYKLVAGQTLLAVAAFSVVCDEVNLLNIAVSGEFQRQGYGSSLLRQCLSGFAEKNLKRCFLEVRRSNKAAISVYTKLGFAGIGERKNYYPAEGGREDALVLLCQLNRKD